MAARRKAKSKRPKGVRVEVRVAKKHVALVRRLATVLDDPGRASALRKALEPFVREPTPPRTGSDPLTDGTYALDDEGERMWDEILEQIRNERHRGFTPVTKLD